MARNPTTKFQVQAHQFVLRRLESALVRRDAVLLHEPLRRHSRATVVGLIIGALGLLGFLVVGLFSPAGKLGDAQVVVAKESGGVYVLAKDPKQLIPTRNIASAKLLVIALSQAHGGGVGQVQVQSVETDALAAVPRTPLTGIEGAPLYLPGPQRQVDPQWAVCDTLPGSDSGASTQVSTTALIGVDRPGRALPPGKALLLAAPTGQTYLVYDGKRHPVDLDDPAVAATYQLNDDTPRPASYALLNAIPQGQALVPPQIPRAGQPAPFAALSGIQIGDVVRVQRAQQVDYWLILADGRQSIPPLIVDLIRFHRASSAQLPTVSLSNILNVPEVPQASEIDFSGYPSQIPEIVGPDTATVACLSWTGNGSEEPPTTEITIGDEVPLPGDGMEPVPVRNGDAAARTLDSVFLPPAHGALVRGVAPGQQPNSGPIFLVTDLGMKYGVPSIEVAKALGLGDDPEPAPQAILRLLPVGPPLSPQAALQLYDPQLAARRLQEKLASG